MHDSIGPAPQYPLIKLGMTRPSDNERVGFKLSGEFDNSTHRMPGENVGMESHMMVLRHFARTLYDRAIAASSGPDFL